MQRLILAIVVLAIIIGGGYFAYDYLKEKPPAFLIKLLTKTAPPPPLPGGDYAPLKAPPGFVTTIFARDIPGARVLTRDNKGTMLASLTQSGKVVAFPDRDNNGEAGEVVTILQGLKQPHGIWVNCTTPDESCLLFVAETGELKTYRYDADTLTASYEETRANFSTGDGHFTRTLLPHPNGEELLISVGSSCNVCNEESPLRATVLALNLVNNELSVFAKGLRNTVFMATDPVTGEIWGTDNGRDVIGDDIPPDEVNIIREGNDYGWPICYGRNIHDTDFDKKQYVRDPCADKISPHIEIQAHSAPLGLAFIPEEGWPQDMGNDLLVAYHGSWNRSVPTGYRVVRFDLTNNRQTNGGPIDFLSGFLEVGATEDQALGRPVGLLAEPGGTVYVSDDRAGAIYKVSWQGE